MMDKLKKNMMKDLQLFFVKSMVVINAVLLTSVEYVKMLQLIQMNKDNACVACSSRNLTLLENVNLGIPSARKI